MLTKTVLCAAAGGAVSLVEVPFAWRHGEPLPADAIERPFPNATEALRELAAHGRNQNRVHVPMPSRTRPAARRPSETVVVGSHTSEGLDADTAMADLS